MKKKSILYHDKIDLFALLKVILDGKIKIFIITFISFLIGVGYSYQIPNDYLISLTISKNNNSEFQEKYDLLNTLLNEEFSNSKLAQTKLAQISNNDTNELILNKFFNELQDREEFLLYLGDIEKVKEKVSKLPLEMQEKELYKYRKLLNIAKGPNIILNLKWDNIDEAKNILKNMINLTLINSKKSIIDELYNRLEHEKKLISIRNLKRLTYLKEQRWIAKELNISDNQIKFFTSNTYYLMGYMAIDKEIQLIENRDYQNFKFIKQEIDSLKKESNNLMNYNIHSAKVAFLKNTKLILIISILLGLIFGAFYVVISNAFKSKIVSKKSILFKYF